MSLEELLDILDRNTLVLCGQALHITAQTLSDEYLHCIICLYPFELPTGFGLSSVPQWLAPDINLVVSLRIRPANH